MSCSPYQQVVSCGLTQEPPLSLAEFRIHKVRTITLPSIILWLRGVHHELQSLDCVVHPKSGPFSTLAHEDVPESVVVHFYWMFASGLDTPTDGSPHPPGFGYTNRRRPSVWFPTCDLGWLWVAPFLGGVRKMNTFLSDHKSQEAWKLIFAGRGENNGDLQAAP